MKKFEWMPAYEKAFALLKVYLIHLPLLSKPKARELLFLYQAIYLTIVSSVLV